MINRVVIYLIFAVLFAITQTGVATHAISHLEAHTKLSHSDDKDQNTTQEHCQQCLGHAQADTATLAGSYLLPKNTNQHILATIPVARLVSRLPELYSARAPPVSQQI